MPKPSVLVVDDSTDMLNTLVRNLSDHGFTVETATSGKEALERFARAPSDVVLTDLRMKELDGMDVLEGIHRVDPHAPVVLMTAFGNVDGAVDAIQRGAFHYITKPFKLANVRVLLDRAVNHRTLREQNRQLKEMFNERFAARELIGASAAMRSLRALIERVASAQSPVLIVGETGTGKELVARAIHVASDRREGAFVAVSCAAMPETLLESELFGHSQGAFPGATHARRGLFAEADGGTLFLDEVADMPLALQGKLLRVLESGEIRPVGSEATRRVDVRCMASTHADLSALVRARGFREDLFFRLNVVPVRVPALRERPEDIALLAGHFLNRTPPRGRGPRRILADDARRALEAHPWPGNVRELENLIERLVVTKLDAEIDGLDVETALMPTAPGDPFEALAASATTLEELEQRYVAVVLQRTQGNRAKAATILGIDPSTLYRRTKPR
jgi:two-component system response regulator HydG